MQKTTYRLVRTADDYLVIETRDREMFVQALRDLVQDFADPKWLDVFKDYTIATTTVASEGDTTAEVWSYLR